MTTPPPAPSPQPVPEDIAAYVDATAALLGLTVAPGDRDAVVAAFRGIVEVAADLMAQPLEDSLEAAPVFRP